LPVALADQLLALFLAPFQKAFCLTLNTLRFGLACEASIKSHALLGGLHHHYIRV
jgi:hypothetical protein